MNNSSLAQRLGRLLISPVMPPLPGRGTKGAGVARVAVAGEQDTASPSISNKQMMQCHAVGSWEYFLASWVIRNSVVVFTQRLVAVDVHRAHHPRQCHDRLVAFEDDRAIETAPFHRTRCHRRCGAASPRQQRAVRSCTDSCESATVFAVAFVGIIIVPFTFCAGLRAGVHHRYGGLKTAGACGPFDVRQYHADIRSCRRWTVLPCGCPANAVIRPSLLSSLPTASNILISITR
jgi:hypothetical protein